MSKCPRVGETECGFSPRTHCKKLKWVGDVFTGHFEKPCEICDTVVEYWDERKDRDRLRPLRENAEEPK